MLVHIIADYGPGDLAFAEVIQRINIHLPDAEPILTPVPAFCTLAAGFCIAQLGLNEAPPGTIIYHNIAPRADDERARAGNAGERLSFARLPTGVRVIGVNAGYALSFVRDAAEELRWASTPAEGSQFRSRDLFPQAAAAIALCRPNALGERIKPEEIPAIPPACIGYIDGYGNLKTTIRYEPQMLRVGSLVRVEINGTERTAVVSDGTFGVGQGELAFAPGSRGWKVRGVETWWMELFLRGGSAWELFNRPAIGARITLIPLPGRKKE